MHNILIVDDESGIRDSLTGVLEDEGYKTSQAESGEACLRLLEKHEIDVVLLDIWLPGIDGLDTLQKIRELDSPPEGIMISGHATIERAVVSTVRAPFSSARIPAENGNMLLTTDQESMYTTRPTRAMAA